MNKELFDTRHSEVRSCALNFSQDFKKYIEYFKIGVAGISFLPTFEKGHSLRSILFGGVK